MVAVVDSGSGNLRSVKNALARAGGAPRITSDPEEVARADRVVVPGQGNFGDCARSLRERGLADAVREVIASGRPYLGICLGFQILYEESDEDPAAPGLGVLAGRCARFEPRPDAPKVPHMGWNLVRAASGHRGDPLARAVAESYVYFVHSYYVVPADPASVALTCDYGASFAAAVRHKNIFACQFHPEKSADAGLALLRAFVSAGGAAEDAAR